MPACAMRLARRRERRQELRGARAREHALDERRDRVLVLLVRDQPARVELRLLDRLDHVGLEPSTWIDRVARGKARYPRAPGRSGTRRCDPARARCRRWCAGALFSRIHFADFARPRIRHLRKDVDAGAHVLAELRVVRRGREHLVRPGLEPARVRLVELLDRSPDARGIAADLVQRQQHVVAIERRVLDALRLQRPCVLLELHREAQTIRAPPPRRPADTRRADRGPRLVGPLGVARHHDLAEEIEEQRLHRGIAPAGAADRALEHGAIVGRPSALVDVGAVHGEARDDLGEHVAQAVEREVARSPVALADARSRVCASTFSSLAIAVSMISRLLS